MDPLIRLRLGDQRRDFRPGDRLECEYTIDAANPHDVQAIEASVLWQTDGKGDQDLGVHYFERHTRGHAEENDLRRPHGFTTKLPNSPLSYAGSIVKISWCVRVRVFLGRGREVAFEQPFQLGMVPPARAETL